MYFEEVAIRGVTKGSVGDLKTTLEQIYTSLGSIEPEIVEIEARRKVRK